MSKLQSIRPVDCFTTSYENYKIKIMPIKILGNLFEKSESNITKNRTYI